MSRAEDWTPDQAQWPEWMKAAARDVGAVRENPGAGTHPRIAIYYTYTGLGGQPEDDHAPWCSAAMNCWMHEAGYRGTARANARSWLSWGEQLKRPKLGCVVVLWRGNPAGQQGHVALWCEESRAHNSVMLLGGNQGNRVSFQRYPLERVIGYRWPSEADRMTVSTA